MGVNYRDLSPAMKAQVDAKLAAQGERTKRKRTSQKQAPAAEGAPLRCCAPGCNKTFDHWGVELERHSAEARHVRFEMILGDAPNRATVDRPTSPT